MHRYFFAVKDTFINSGSDNISGEDFQDKNVGQDEILEIKKSFFNREFDFPTRALIQFETSEIESFLSSSDVAAGDYEASLRLYETKGTSGLSETYTIAAYPLSESWEEGVGKEADVPKTTEGCSWLYRKNRDGASEISWATPGGTFIADDEATQSFNLEKPDINMNVTSIVQKILEYDLNNINYFILNITKLAGASSTGENNTYNGDFSNVKALVMQKQAIGTVKLMDLAVERTSGDFEVMYQGTLMAAKYAMGHGILRPECAVEIKATA